MAEVLATGPGASKIFRTLEHTLNRCKSYPATSNGQKATVHVGHLSFPAVGQHSSAYAMTLSVQGISAGADLVVFRVEKFYGAFTYSDIGTPDVREAQRLVTAAVDKIENKKIQSGNETYAMGQTVRTPPTIDGIVSATVYGFYPNVQSSQPDVDQPPAGKTYAAIDAQECAGSSGSNAGANETDFTILLSNGSTAGDPDFLVGDPTVAPLSSESELGSGSQSLGAGQCDRGWVVFDIPNGVTPTFVQFSGTTASFSQANTVAKWTISTS